MIIFSLFLGLFSNLDWVQIYIYIYKSNEIKHSEKLFMRDMLKNIQHDSFKVPLVYLSSKTIILITERNKKELYI